MKRWPCLCTTIAVAACLAPAAVQGQDTAAPSRSQTRVLSLDASFLRTLPPTLSVSGPTGSVLGDALGDQLNYYSELLDSYHFPDPSYESDFEDYLVRKYGDRTIDLADRERPDRGRSCGAVTGAAPVSTADRVHRPRCAAASSQIDRPYLSAQ